MTTRPERVARPLALLTLALLLLLFALPAAAQNAPRVPPSNDNTFGAQFVSAPFSETVTTILEATVQAGETQPCIGGTGAKSVWYVVHAPAGVTLVVDTSASNYNTVVSVWQDSPNSDPTGFVNLDCENDRDLAAVLRYPVTVAGQYQISISETPDVSPRAPHILSVSFSFDVPTSLAPGGSDPDHAVPLKFNKTTTLSGMEYGAAHDPVVANPACSANTLQYAAWFKITVPFAMTVDISAQGSLFAYDTTLENTVSLDLFPEGFDDITDDLACAVTTGASSANIKPTLQPGVYYLRALRKNVSQNAVGPSRYKITLSMRDTDNLLVNPDFENIAEPLQGWKVKNGTGDAVSVFIDHAFFFSGAAGENSQLQQTVTFSPPLPVNDDLTLNLDFEALGSPGTPPFTLSLKLTFTDGTVSTIKRKVATGSSSFPTILTTLPKKTLSKARIAIKFTATSGSLIVDNFDLQLNGFAFREATGSAALPLPLPPAR